MEKTTRYVMGFRRSETMFGLDLMVGVKDNAGLITHTAVAKDLEFKEYCEGTRIDSFLVGLDDEFLQCLADSLGEEGYYAAKRMSLGPGPIEVPYGKPDRDMEMEAVRYHLEDLRKLINLQEQTMVATPVEQKMPEPDVWVGTAHPNNTSCDCPICRANR